jgi:predicted GNAT family acetyltransferase
MEVAVLNNEVRKRFEVSVNGETAYLMYRREPGAIVFIHTHVPEALEGHGAGSALAKAGLEFARGQNLQIVPLCPFVADYIQRHPMYSSLVRA